MLELQPGDHLGARPCPRRVVRQMARQCPRLVDLAQPLLGFADPGVEKRRPRISPDRRVRQSIAELERDFGVRAEGPAPPGDRPAGPPQPRRPDRPGHDAAGDRRARLLVRVRVDAVRPGALSVREPANGSSSISRPISSWSTSARRGAGSTPCTCWRPPCSTARRFGPAWRTGSCSATTARRCRSGCATTPTPRPCSPSTGPTPCAGSCCRRRSCAAATSSPTRRASSAPSVPSSIRCGTPGTSSRCTPTPTG